MIVRGVAFSTVLLMIVLSPLSLCAEEKIRIASIASIQAINIYDLGIAGEKSVGVVDVIQNVCDSEGNLEPFEETYVGLELKNNTYTSLRLKRFYFIVKDAFGSGSDYRSPRMALSGRQSVPPGDEIVETKAVFLMTNDTDKQFVGSSTLLSAFRGLKDVTFFITAITGRGRTVRKRVVQTVYFTDLNRCAD